MKSARAWSFLGERGEGGQPKRGNGAHTGSVDR